MRVYIITNFIGVFALDEKGNILEYKLFNKNPKIIAKKIIQSQKEVIEEERKVIKSLDEKTDEFVFSTKKEKNKISKMKYESDNIAERYFRSNFRNIMKRLNIFKTQTELNKFLTRTGVELTKEVMRHTVKRDVLIIQAIGALDEIDKTINIHTERIREWYSFHFPEMDKLIKNHEKFVKIIYEFGFRDIIEDKELQEYSKESAGLNLSKKDIDILQKFADEIMGLYKLRKSIENYIDNVLKEIAPNTREIAGSLLCARLIAAAGGLNKLAKMPSSSVQIMGAEKALFRFLHGRGRSPKYGYIYLHPLIQKAPKKKHGKIARLLASKISIAAKLDYYGKKFKGKELKEDLEKKVTV